MRRGLRLLWHDAGFLLRVGFLSGSCLGLWPAAERARCRCLLGCLRRCCGGWLHGERGGRRSLLRGSLWSCSKRAGLQWLRRCLEAEALWLGYLERGFLRLAAFRDAWSLGFIGAVLFTDNRERRRLPGRRAWLGSYARRTGGAGFGGRSLAFTGDGKRGSGRSRWRFRRGGLVGESFKYASCRAHGG